VYSVTAALHFWGSILGATREYAVLGGGDGSRIWTKPLEIPLVNLSACRLVPPEGNRNLRLTGGELGAFPSTDCLDDLAGTTPEVSQHPGTCRGAQEVPRKDAMQTAGTRSYPARGHAACELGNTLGWSG
jgi:hypothetical protein